VSFAYLERRGAGGREKKGGVGWGRGVVVVGSVVVVAKEEVAVVVAGGGVAGGEVVVVEEVELGGGCAGIAAVGVVDVVVGVVDVEIVADIVDQRGIQFGYGNHEGQMILPLVGNLSNHLQKGP